MLILGIHSFFACFFVLILLFKTKGTISGTVKFVMINGLFAAFVRAGTFFVHSIYNFATYFLPVGATRISNLACYIKDITAFTNTDIFSYLFLIISVSMIQTIYKSIISEVARRVKYILTVFGVLLAWFWVISLFFIGMSENRAKLSDTICYCTFVYLAPMNFVVFLVYLNSSLQFITCTISWLVYMKNRQMISKFDTSGQELRVLTPRYNMWLSLQTTRWLAPMVLLNSLMSLVSFIVLNVGLRFLENSTENRDSVTQLMITMLAVQNAFYPLICVR